MIIIYLYNNPGMIPFYKDDACIDLIEYELVSTILQQTFSDELR